MEVPIAKYLFSKVQLRIAQGILRAVYLPISSEVLARHIVQERKDEKLVEFVWGRRRISHCECARLIACSDLCVELYTRLTLSDREFKQWNSLSVNPFS